MKLMEYIYIYINNYVWKTLAKIDPLKLSRNFEISFVSGVGSTEKNYRNFVSFGFDFFVGAKSNKMEVISDFGVLVFFFHPKGKTQKRASYSYFILVSPDRQGNVHNRNDCKFVVL